MGRRSSSSSRRQSSESDDHTSSTSVTSAEPPVRDKGKGRALLDYDEEERRGGEGRRYPLSAPRAQVGEASSSRHTLRTTYPLSTRSQARWRFDLSHVSGRRKILHYVLALSIPVLGLLLANELRISRQRTRLHGLAPVDSRTTGWEAMDLDTPSNRIVEARKQYRKKRRRQAELERRWQGASLPLLPSHHDSDWTLADEEHLDQEVREHWPKWWGNADVVGASPYDHKPVSSGGERKRVLFLTSYDDYLKRMNTHTYEIVDAALRHPAIFTDVWGPGWKGYDPDLSLSVNVQRRARRIEQLEQSRREYEYRVQRAAHVRAEELRRKERWAKWSLGLVHVDVPAELAVQGWAEPEWLDAYDSDCGPVKWEVVWTISDIFKRWDEHLNALSCGALLVQQLGDCHEFRCFKEWYPQANNITLSKYAFELEEIFTYDRVKEAYPDWQMGIFGHNPDTANEWDFYPTKWSEKVEDATMFGFDGSFYPIRTTITDRHHAHNRDKSIPEPLVKHHRHPGYSVSTDNSLREDPMETYIPGHWSYENHRKLREDFARGMRQARICVFDSSLERKLIRKYAQALLSGCVVAGDIPTEQEEPLSKFMIQLQPSWKIERIEEELRKYLADPARLEQMAMDGFIYARRYLTTTRKIDHVLAMADSYRNGVRGYEYPYGFSLRCRAYWNNNNAYRPPWCVPQSMRGLES